MKKKNLKNVDFGFDDFDQEWEVEREQIEEHIRQVGEEKFIAELMAFAQAVSFCMEMDRQLEQSQRQRLLPRIESGQKYLESVKLKNKLKNEKNR